MKRIAAALILAGGLFLPTIGLAEDGVSPGTFVANNGVFVANKPLSSG